ncbi:glycine zipper 2TM domain-containing protein [Sphingomonas morindae]|uniref:17 kDa surface antigen n=1 Tax=Sphingomonas morindae TaxID=1541170 RepID=A0ABY4XB30_9SPHN|nr:glycine zipper 2TM domain-containing protein [Sphingomonas morindae]USI74176.1 glycine zipper 2TM domain-containing protein [Sphingomonas morindae]
MAVKEEEDMQVRRPWKLAGALVALLPLAGCYEDGYGAGGYGAPPPPPPPPGYYQDRPPPPPPGYYGDRPPPPGYDRGYDNQAAPPPPPPGTRGDDGYRDEPPPPPPPPQDGGYRQAPPPADWQRYDEGRPPPGQDAYYADRYYRPDPGQGRALGRDDRVYRGQDGRYYCRRSDGTTGLIVGAVAGGILGNLIDGGHSRVLGTLLGGGGGALLGKSIDQGQVVCR